MFPLGPFEQWGDVPNVVFTCGGVKTEDGYLIYYGGGDHVMAAASVSQAEVRAFTQG